MGSWGRCDNGANIHSKRTDSFDTNDDLGLDDGEWEEISDAAKAEIVRDWAMERFDYGWHE